MQLLKNKRYTVPVLGIGITWILYAIFGEFRHWTQFLVCAMLSVIAFIALRMLMDRLFGKEAPVQKKQEPAKTPEKSRTELLLELGEQYLQQIRTLNEQIPGLEMSAKLKQLEELMKLIFQVVRQQPEKQNSIDQMMRYYLPTTIKLLKQYVTLQDQKVQGENIGDGMQKVEGMLDGVILALQKQHDAMFRADVIDITADIRVMEKKLAAEGLTDNDDFKEIL